MVAAKALITPKVGDPFEVRDVELDELRAHEVLVDIEACGICHTDIAVQHGKIPVPLPAVLGHEGAGVIRAVGSEVSGLEPGDHVVLSYNSCGLCRGCQNKLPYQCDQAQRMNFGGSRNDGSSTVLSAPNHVSTCFFGQSSFCNPAIVQEGSCVKVDDDLPLKVVCALGCGFQTGAGSIFNVIKPLERKSRHVAVFGIGAVGCAAIMAANHLAKSAPEKSFDIIAIDVNDVRLDLARELGASHTVNPTKEKVGDTVNQVTGDNGLDACVDCTGVLSVITEMIDLVGPGGIAVTVGGPPPGAKVPVDVFSMLIKCKTYAGCHQGNAHSQTFIPWLAELYRDGDLPLEKLQKTYRAEDINTACDDMVSGRVLKPVLVWES